VDVLTNQNQRRSWSIPLPADMIMRLIRFANNPRFGSFFTTS
jgi:hypothetical protein